MAHERILVWLGIEEWTPRARRLLAVVGASGLALALGAWWLTLSRPEELYHPEWNGLHWLLLCLLTISVSGLSMKLIGTSGIITVSDTFVFTSVLLFGGPPSVVIGWLDGLVATLRATRKPASILYSSSLMALSLAAGCVTFEGVRRLTGSSTQPAPLVQVILPLAALTGVHFAITTLGVSGLLCLRSGKPLRELWRRDFAFSGLTYLTGAATSLVTYRLIQSYGMSAFFMVVPLVLLAYWSHHLISSRLVTHSLELEQRVAERTLELETANERLREIDRLKTEFLNVVAHDLRTPLTSIMAYAQMMAEHPERTEKFPHYAKIIFEETGRLRDLINNVLDLSKMEAGKMVYEMEQLQLEEMLEHFYKLFQSLALSQKVQLELHVHDSLPPVRGDRNRIGQALCNLLNNAVKFTRDHGRVRIEAYATEQDGRSWVYVSVSDQGPGIPQEDWNRIFEKYHTVQRQPNRAKEGTGLGLPIARQILESHEGRIGVESVLGAGSTFWFQIPALLPEPAGAEAATPALDGASGGAL